MEPSASPSLREAGTARRGTAETASPSREPRPETSSRLSPCESYDGEISVAKVAEISATSPTSFEDAIRAGLARACRTLENVRGAWIKEMNVRVVDDRVVEFRVNMKVTFVLNDE